MINRINKLIEQYVDRYAASLIKEEGFVKTSLQDINEVDIEKLKKHIIKHVYLLDPYLDVRVEIYDLWEDSKSLEIYFTPKDIPTT